MLSFTWAWFVDDAINTGNSITTGTYTMSVEVKDVTDAEAGNIVEAQDGIWTFEGGKNYKITLTAAGTEAQKGYCLISEVAAEATAISVPGDPAENETGLTVTGATEVGTYIEEKVQLYTDSIVSGNSLSFEMQLDGTGNRQFTFLSKWGKGPTAEEGKDIIENGEVIPLTTVGAVESSNVVTVLNYTTEVETEGESDENVGSEGEGETVAGSETESIAEAGSETDEGKNVNSI